MISKNIIFLVAAFMTLHVRAQEGKKVLGIGDRLPVFNIAKIINSTKVTNNTKDYLDKLLIIDFWSTSCSGCVAALPRMENLQLFFGKQIKILPVTSENKTYTLNFLKNNKYTKKLKIQSVVEDHIFNNYFKYQYLPHEVWIYKGKVIAITDQQYVDRYNIEQVLNGKQINWPVKYDFYTFDDKKPLFKLDERQIDINSKISYAAISGYREKYSSVLLNGVSDIIRDSTKKTIRTYLLNESIFAAYVLNWMKLEKLLIKPSSRIQQNQIVWEVNNKSRYLYDNRYNYLQKWLRDNGICFESLYPDNGQNNQQVYHSIISDLDRLLGLSVRWEKRREKVFVIMKNIEKADTTQWASGRNYMISSLVSDLNDISSNPYVFDESKDRKTKMPLLDSISLKDFSIVRKMLRIYGFDLKEETREVDKLIFSEIENGRLIDVNMQTQSNARKNAQKDLKEPLPEENRSFLENNKKQIGIRVTNSGLQYKILKVGTGFKPGPRNKVCVNYEGTLVNGKIFDSSYEIGQPGVFEVDQVIKGWGEALQMMSEGSKWVLYIPAELAYGSHTNQGKIPPNSTLIFEIDMIKILP